MVIQVLQIHFIIIIIFFIIIIIISINNDNNKDIIIDIIIVYFINVSLISYLTFFIQLLSVIYSQTNFFMQYYLPITINICFFYFYNCKTAQH